MSTLTAPPGFTQASLESWTGNATTFLPPRPFTVKAAVFRLLDDSPTLRGRVLGHDRGALWTLTHRVGALLGHKINPATVDRRVREYKNGR